MAITNSVNASSQGYQVLNTSTGVWSGRTFTAGTGIAITNGDGTAGNTTIASSGTTTLTVTSVNFAASPYTVLSTDQFLSVLSAGGAITIRLPNAPATGRVYTIKDASGAASTNNISITTVGGTVLIDGVTTTTIAGNYGSISVIFDGTAYLIW
jgi:hypothetical protein